MTAAHNGNLGTATPWQARFWRFVPAQRTPSQCWEWEGTRLTAGYGRLMLTKKPQRTVVAHRASWAIHNNGGRLPDADLKVCHHCDNPPCVNPAHLFIGTQAENVADMNRKGRHVSAWGEQNPLAKWSAAQVAEVRHLIAEGLPQGEISARTGVTVTSVKNIRRGRRARG